MDARISMITLGVRDLARAVAFYQDGLGLPRHGDGDDVAFFNLNGSWLGLYGWDALAEDAGLDAAGTGFRGVALAHNVESPEAVDALLAHVATVGGEIVKPPEKVFWGGYSGYFRDPDGHLWEVAHNPFTWIGPAASEPAD